MGAGRRRRFRLFHRVRAGSATEVAAFAGTSSEAVELATEPAAVGETASTVASIASFSTFISLASSAWRVRWVRDLVWTESGVATAVWQ